ncbi:YigZ family protein [Mangrovactinospora gilvigrisea]|uniref:YigZ family protein n=1 Tax=Mangrovactinospora gilvigrisea TaxID=1428644 RepID=A0A1J7CCT7_9ACTN|nr:YigZ family protein [Mangrovactinospora gilvigrisea]OIV37498.1 YigZ family protein [Mangrovactinospora gilvigrisea]
MRTIRADGEHETEVKKSRFLCALRRVGTEEQARAFVAERKKQYWNASHNCSAFVLGRWSDVERSNDDGEPSGTAGVPMLEVLRRRELTDVVAVVTRWFGGTRLGAGGLVRAYGGAVAEAVDAVGVVELRDVGVFAVESGHAGAGRLENELRGSRFELLGVGYGAGVRFEVGVPDGEEPAFAAWLAETTGGGAEAERVGTRVVEVPL